jgi:hypothetical protein
MSSFWRIISTMPGGIGGERRWRLDDPVQERVVSMSASASGAGPGRCPGR